jgi:hypothetical protein
MIVQKSESFESLPGTFAAFKSESEISLPPDLGPPVTTREKLIKEVIETEDSYVASLKIAVHVLCIFFSRLICQMYLVPLNFASTSTDPILSPKEITVIFSDLMMIYNFAKQFLKMLHDRFPSTTSMDTEKIGDIFLQMVGFQKSENL